ncbi:MAG: cytochrome c [Alphaproteobacteria bacterium]|nr:cytochrome c [Alphaproteobacteria bacterium]MDE1985120.1 cytochrome c [Alphaproteobacteria bacterium]MDE2499835.1 cytochrome c [Alphaproteobacteria bacterium]
MKTLGLAAVVVFTLCTATAGILAAETSLGNVVKARQASLHKLGRDFKIIADQLKADKPDMATVQSSAQDIKALSAAMGNWFPAGSGAEASLKTKAKPEIWTDASGFAAKLAGFRSEAAKLQQVAASGDVDALKTQFKATGETCRACHTDYRSR